MRKDTRSAYMQLAKRLEPTLRRAFRRSIADIVDSIVLKNVEAAIRSGNVEAVMRSLNLSPQFFAPMDRAVSEIFRAGAESQLEAVPKRPVAPAASRIIVRFDGRHPRAESLIREQASRQIVELLTDQREIITEKLAQGLTENRGYRKTALDLAGKIDKVSGRRKGGLVGLTKQQAGYVTNMKHELRSPFTSESYFSRKLRDKLYDEMVQKSIDTGTPLTSKQINAISGQYTDNLKEHRGKTIARTETNSALNRGKSEAVDQLIDSGKVTEQMVRKIWDSTPSGRTRDSHSSLNGTNLPKNQAFVSINGGRMMYPLDTSLGAPAGEIVNCRCSVRYRIDYRQQAA